MKGKKEDILQESTSSERGQVLVIMVFGIIVLLIVAGLAVDGGTVLMERRHAQNAADAAALGGTRELAKAICEDPGSDDASVLAEVTKFVMENDIPDAANSFVAFYVDNRKAELGEVGAGSIPVGSTGVKATVNIRRPTYLLPLIGIDTAGASAQAIAVTGPLLRLAGGGLRPFGVPHDLIEGMGDGDTFEIIFKHDGGEYLVAGQPVAQHRGWMNMNYMWHFTEAWTWPRAPENGDHAGASDLRAWMEDGANKVLFTDCFWANGCQNGDFIHAKPGTNSTAVCAAPQYDPFPIPIYDYIADCSTEIVTNKPDCPKQGGSFVYHIVGVAFVQVTGCNQGGGEIDLELQSQIVGQGIPDLKNTGYGQSRACDSHTQLVTLWD